jgi:hypothetical protein
MLRNLYASVAKKLRREVPLRALFFLPEDSRRQLERWLRGREEFGSLRRSDVAIVSCGKSGRTWLRMLMSRFFQIRYGVSGGLLIKGDNYGHGDIPRILFTHDSYIHYYTGNFHSKIEYRKVKTMLIVRHPADVAVSQYFQWKHRIQPRKKWLNEYPLDEANTSMFDLVMHPKAGIPYVVDFLNNWGREWQGREDLSVVRYEDMSADTPGQLRRILGFLGFEATDMEIEECVRFASFENMRRIEEHGVFRFAGRGMRGKKSADPDVFLVRRGKAGGWRDYFSDDQGAAIERYIEEHLEPGFGYLRSEANEPVTFGMASRAETATGQERADLRLARAAR